MQIAVKKVGDKFEGALIVDGRFQRALSSEHLSSITSAFLVGVINAQHNQGTEISFDIEVSTEVEIQAALAAQKK
jgi:hypothetical protein